MTDVNYLLKKYLYKIQCIEEHIVENLPVFIEKSNSKKLINEFESYKKTSSKHLEVLNNFINDLDIDDSISNCNSIKSLVNEVKSYVTLPNDNITDAGLIANFERLMTSKTSLYTSALRFSRELSLKTTTHRIQKLLNDNYDFIYTFDKIEEDRLTKKDILRS